MPRYRTIPVEVDAIRFDGTHANIVAVMTFMEAGTRTTELRIHAELDPAKSSIDVPTAAGWVRVFADGWIVRGADGDLSVVRAARFGELYEAV